MKRHLENRAIEALRETLSQISVIKIKEIEVEDFRPRGERTIIARVEIYGHAHELVCKLVGSSDTDELQRAFSEFDKLNARFSKGMASVLIAPSLSEEAQNLCRTGILDFWILKGTPVSIWTKFSS